MTEQQEYRVIKVRGVVELREYAPWVVADVVASGSAEQAGSAAFRPLFEYISGANRGAEPLAMTAPVIQQPTSERLAMTAPVTQTPSGSGFLVQFVLPKDITLANAPEPLDSRVMLREVPPKRVAVIRYSGFWSESNYKEHLAKLQDELRAAAIAWSGEPVFSRYNAPFTPWFLRRNEIWLQLAP